MSYAYKYINGIRASRLEENGGAHTQAEWKAKIAWQKYKCANPYCACDLRKCDYEQDHIIPVVSGGTDDIGNIQALCTPCNRRKGVKAWKVFLREEKALAPLFAHHMLHFLIGTGKGLIGTFAAGALSCISWIGLFGHGHHRPEEALGGIISLVLLWFWMWGKKTPAKFRGIIVGVFTMLVILFYPQTYHELMGVPALRKLTGAELYNGPLAIHYQPHHPVVAVPPITHNVRGPLPPARPTSARVM